MIQCQMKLSSDGSGSSRSYLTLLKSKLHARSFKDPSLDPKQAQLSLHAFTDVSDCAVAGAVYLRAKYPDGTTRVTLAVFKAKPAPLHRQSISMLEL